MAFESNKENFFARLKSDSFEVASLAENTEALQETLRYLDSRRAQEIVNDILNPSVTSSAEAKQIITNLAKLYPLSRDVVMGIMSSSRAPKFPDQTFLLAFDASQAVRKEIVAVFSEVKRRTIDITRDTRDYQSALEKLQAEQERLEQAATELQTLRDERNNLQDVVNRLREDTDREKLQAQIDALEAEKNQLEGERHRQQSEIEQRRKNIREVKAELADLEKYLDPSEELNLLRELFKKFPADAEG